MLLKYLFILLFSVLLTACSDSSDQKFTKVKDSENQNIVSKEIPIKKTEQEKVPSEEKNISSPKKPTYEKQKETLQVNIIAENKDTDLKNIDIEKNKEESTIMESTGVDYSIKIDENNIELVNAVKKLTSIYSKKVKDIKSFYKDKRLELDTNYVDVVNTSRKNLETLTSKFKNDCSIFTKENIKICNKLKLTIDESRNVVEKGDYEIINMRKKMEISEKRELAAELITLQKRILVAKNSFIDEIGEL